MYRIIIFLFLTISFTALISGCNNNKIACPTYAESFPEKKKKTRPGTQKPVVEKISKPRSGVMPGDGRGSKTKVPK
jgi:hypothetical protein